MTNAPTPPSANEDTGRQIREGGWPKELDGVDRAVVLFILICIGLLAASATIGFTIRIFQWSSGLPAASYLYERARDPDTWMVAYAVLFFGAILKGVTSGEGGDSL